MGDEVWTRVAAWSDPGVAGEHTLLVPAEMASSVPSRALLRPVGGGGERAAAAVRGPGAGFGGQLSPPLAARLGADGERGRCDVELRPLRLRDLIRHGEGGLLASVGVLLTFVGFAVAAFGTYLTSSLPPLASLALFVAGLLVAAGKATVDLLKL